MKACLPIAHDLGLESRVHPHFGTAPMFLIVDTDTKATHAVENPKRDHEHGRCLPLDLLVHEQVDVVVVGGIGAGALGRLSAARIAAYHGAHGTAGEVLDAVVRGELLAVLPEDTCGGRSGPHGHGCSGHGHDAAAGHACGGHGHEEGAGHVCAGHGHHGTGGHGVQLRFRGGREG